MANSTSAQRDAQSSELSSAKMRKYLPHGLVRNFGLTVSLRMSGGGHTKFRANLAVQSAPKSSRELGIPIRDDALLHAVEAVYTVMINICDLRGSSSGGKREEAHHLAEHIRHCEAGVDDLSLVRNGWEA